MLKKLSFLAALLVLAPGCAGLSSSRKLKEARIEVENCIKDSDATKEAYEALQDDYRVLKTQFDLLKAFVEKELAK